MARLRHKPQHLAEEYRVLEFSPKGEWVRLMNPHGLKFWAPAKDVGVIETLAQPEKVPTS